MAKIEIVGFVNSVKEINGSWVVELAEKHRRRNQAGEWETDGTATYYDVWMQDEHAFVQENALVRVNGSFKTKKSTYNDKMTGEPRVSYRNTVNAFSCEPVGASNSPTGGSPLKQAFPDEPVFPEAAPF